MIERKEIIMNEINKKESNNSNMVFEERFMKKWKIVVSIFGGFAAGYPVINTIYNKIYQNKCEEYYQIPRQYFHENVEDRLIYLCFIIIFLLICISPIVVRKILAKKKKANIDIPLEFSIIALGMGGTIGILNILNFVEIVEKTYNINFIFTKISIFLLDHSISVMVVLVLLGYVSMAWMLFSQGIAKIKFRWAKAIITIVCFVATFINVLLLLLGTVSKLRVDIENQVSYEIVQVYDDKYVVLSEIDDKLLVVPYEINENDIYIFKSGKYSFVDKYEGSYTYITMPDNPIIDSTIEMNP